MDKQIYTLISRLTQTQREKLAGKVLMLAARKGDQNRQCQTAASLIGQMRAARLTLLPVNTETRRPGESQPEAITRSTRTPLSGSGVHPRATLEARRACGCWLCAK